MHIQFSNSKFENLRIAYQKANGILTVDRRNSGLVDFNDRYKAMSFQTMPVGKTEHLSLQIVLDASSIELFVNNGDYVLTNQIFPSEPFTDLKINNDAILSNFEIKQVKKVLDLF